MLTGAGRGFCSGLDLGEFGDVPGAENLGEVQRTWLVQRSIASLVQQIRRLPQPVIAAVELENRQQVLASATADAREAGAAYRQNRPPSHRNA